MPEPVPFTPLGKLAAALNDPASKDIDDARALAEGLDPYLDQISSPASRECDALEHATRAENWSAREEQGETSLPLTQTMLSGNLEGQFLKTLLSFGNAQRVLEIGLFTGYGALAMAEALPEDGELLALEIDQYAADFARSHFDQSEHGRKIEIMVGPAASSLAKLADQSACFDFIFIDADKPGYIDYYDTVLERDLLAPHGLICVDNTLLGGEAYLDDNRSENGEAIALFNEHVAQDDRTVQVMLPLRDGVTLIRRAG